MQTKHQRRPGALALGSLFAAGTCYVLLGDVHHPSELTSDHATSALVLAGTVAAGHLFGLEARSLRVMRSAGLALLFLAGTFYCVTSSAARNAEAPAARAAEARGSNEARSRMEADLAEAREELRLRRADQARECAGGDGTRCRGHSRIVADAQARADASLARLASAAPARQADAGLAHAATVFAAMPLVTADAASIERALALLFPFAKACFMEVATILFVGIGLGEGAARNREEPTGTVGTDEETVEGPWSQDDALLDLRSMTRRGVGRDQRFLAERWGRSKGTVSRWMREWEEDGLVSRSRDGKSKRASA